MEATKASKGNRNTEGTKDKGDSVSGYIFVEVEGGGGRSVTVHEPRWRVEIVWG